VGNRNEQEGRTHIGVLRGLLAICGLAPTSAAQGPIRVESSQVLVPTVVFDKKLYALTNGKHHKHTLSYRIAHGPHIWDTIAVRGLSAGDFHLIEDGREQSILSVTFEAPVFSMVTDNLGKHPQTIGSRGGTWTYPDLPTTGGSILVSVAPICDCVCPPGIARRELSSDSSGCGPPQFGRLGSERVLQHAASHVRPLKRNGVWQADRRRFQFGRKEQDRSQPSSGRFLRRHEVGSG
jgi:hypothetical protein